MTSTQGNLLCIQSPKTSKENSRSPVCKDSATYVTNSWVSHLGGQSLVRLPCITLRSLSTPKVTQPRLEITSITMGGRRDSSVGIAPGYDSRQRKIFFSSSQRPDRLWGSCNLLSKGYWGQFPRGKAPVTTHLHLVPRSRIVELQLHYSIRLQGLIIN
jgi:hypothetical protein